jgi:hypothetical protein
MRKLLIFSFALAIILGNIACNAQTPKKEEKASSSATVEAYYFHFSARCVT